MNYVIEKELKNVPWDASPVPSSMNYMISWLFARYIGYVNVLLSEHCQGDRHVAERSSSDSSHNNKGFL